MSDSMAGRRTAPSFFYMPKSAMKQQLDLIDELGLGDVNSQTFNQGLTKS